ncbi:MAG TPA: primosomal protein N', partial [Verrucomicrobiae bacterium]|nr:primosomal protein N' [Verrucomicrobiae bacterium]
AERRELAYPPAVRLIYLGVISRSREAARERAQQYADAMRASGVCEVLGPAPYPVARLNDEWRYRIALKSRQPKALRAAVRERVLAAAHADRNTRLAVNVDP